MPPDWLNTVAAERELRAKGRAGVALSQHRPGSSARSPPHACPLAAFEIYFIYNDHEWGRHADRKDKVMIYGKIRKVGNSFVITIPREEMIAQGVSEGDTVAVEIRRAAMYPALSPRLREAFEESFRRNEAGYRYLAGR